MGNRLSTLKLPEKQLFHFHKGNFVEIAPVDISYEASLHSMISCQLSNLFKVTLLANEFVIRDQRRIDTIGIDEHGSPVIIEFKVGQDSSVINQALFYAAWIDNNRPVFEALVQQKLQSPPPVNWKGLRVICVTGGYSDYDVLALEQMKTNIDLVKYQMYDLGVLSLSWVGTSRKHDYLSSQNKTTHRLLSIDEKIETLSAVARQCLESLLSAIAEISSDLIITKTDQEWTVFGDVDLARIYITQTKYPSVRIEIFDEDIQWDAYVRHRKTDKGVDLIVSDEKTLSQAVQSLTRIYTKTSFFKPF